MCICLNCQYLNVCKQYNFIEKKHNELHINNNPSFLPSQTIINVNFSYIDKFIEIEWDVIECLSFKEKPGKWLLYIK